MNTARQIVPLALALGSCWLLFACRGRPELLPADSDAPALVGETLDDERWSLRAQRGRPVLAMFVSTECPPCTRAAPLLESLRFAHEELVVVAVSAEDRAALQAWLVEHPVSYPLVRVPYETHRTFAPQLPAFYLVDRQGRIADTELGYGPRLDEELARAIDALLTPEP